MKALKLLFHLQRAVEIVGEGCHGIQCLKSSQERHCGKEFGVYIRYHIKSQDIKELDFVKRCLSDQNPSTNKSM
jgi:hypothetical protein